MLRWIALTLLTLLISSCGFHLAKEAELPANMQKLAIEGVDSYSPLARELGDALKRAGVEVQSADTKPAARLRITDNSVRTDVLSVGGNARANEYSIRHHVEFDVVDAAGKSLLAVQTIELGRDFTFDANQALGVAAEQELLTDELRRDMVQAILRRLQASNQAPAN